MLFYCCYKIRDIEPSLFFALSQGQTVGWAALKPWLLLCLPWTLNGRTEFPESCSLWYSIALKGGGKCLWLSNSLLLADSPDPWANLALQKLLLHHINPRFCFLKDRWVVHRNKWESQSSSSLEQGVLILYVQRWGLMGPFPALLIPQGLTADILRVLLLLTIRRNVESSGMEIERYFGKGSHWEQGLDGFSLEKSTTCRNWANSFVVTLCTRLGL